MTTTPPLAWYAKHAPHLWLAERVGLERRNVFARVFAGLTDEAERVKRLRELIREGIAARRCGWIKCGTNPNTGKPETFAQVFERLFGEKL